MASTPFAVSDGGRFVFLQNFNGEYLSDDCEVCGNDCGSCGTFRLLRMIPHPLRAPVLAVVSASVLSASTAWAQSPPADAAAAPPAPTALEGVPAQAEPGAPRTPQSPPNMTPIAPPTVRRVDASEPRKITGIVLTVIGAYHGFAGSVVLGSFLTADAGDGGFGRAFGLVIGGPLLADGLILTCIGIPLWVSGAKPAEKVDPPVADWVPSVDVGAGTATATWHF